jgi:hypothetical protein
MMNLFAAPEIHSIMNGFGLTLVIEDFLESKGRSWNGWCRSRRCRGARAKRKGHDEHGPSFELQQTIRKDHGVQVV